MAAWKQLVANTGRLIKTVWHDKRWLIIMLAFFVLLLSGSSFFISGSRGLVINKLADLDLAAGLWFWVAVMVAATLLVGLIQIVNEYLGRQLWFYIEAKFELDLIRKRSQIDVATYENPKLNDLFNKVNENGVWRVRSFIDRQFFILQNILEVVIAGVILAVVNWWILLITAITVVPTLITEIKYGHLVWGIHSARAETRRRYWDTRGYFNRLSDLMELKLFQNLGHFRQIIKNLFMAFQDDERRGDRKRLWHQLGSLFVSNLGLAAATIWFVWQVVEGNLLIGTFTFLMASIGDLRQSLSGLFRNLGRQYQDSLFVTDLFRLLDLKPDLPQPRAGFKLDAANTPEIVFDQVSFSYPDSSELVLKNFSLRIPPGEKLALIGINGVGKTTLVKLLCRFYDPTAGRILIAGHDLREIDLDSWYQMLGILFQDYSRYNFTVSDAITVGRTSESPSLIRAKSAAVASEADTFIEKWEHGYEQMLGKWFTSGLEPSTGQWQKLALARTFYRDPRVLVLDEPTSSIDAEAEAKIFAKLESLPPDRTVILISHRFSTVRQANRIAVLENGALTELGSHNALIKLKGTYAKLFNLQARGYQ
ncbi:MAG: ABC transporter ATP-binding protein [Patescibacteria group bacterium]